MQPRAETNLARFTVRLNLVGIAHGLSSARSQTSCQGGVVVAGQRRGRHHKASRSGPNARPLWARIRSRTQAPTPSRYCSRTLRKRLPTASGTLTSATPLSASASSARLPGGDECQPLRLLRHVHGDPHGRCINHPQRQRRPPGRRGHRFVTCVHWNEQADDWAGAPSPHPHSTAQFLRACVRGCGASCGSLAGVDKLHQPGRTVAHAISDRECSMTVYDSFELVGQYESVCRPRRPRSHLHQSHGVRRNANVSTAATAERSGVRVRGRVLGRRCQLCGLDGMLGDGIHDGGSVERRTASVRHCVCATTV